MALPEEDRPQRVTRVAGATPCTHTHTHMPNRYAAEAEAPRILQIQRDLFQRLDLAIASLRTRGEMAYVKKCLLPYLDGTDGKHFDMSTYPPKHFEAYADRPIRSRGGMNGAL